MSLRTLGRALFATLVLGACDRPDRAPPVDTVAAPAAPAEPATVSWTGQWAPEFGDYLLVPADTDATAIVVYPDNPPQALFQTTRLALLTAAGDTVHANVSATRADSLECGGAPVLRLSAGAAGAWAVGLPAPEVVVHTDSVESLSAQDSARVVASLARLASAIPANADSRFTGLPFVVLRARRFMVGGTRVIAAHLARRLPQEASPLEEHTFLVAERSAGSDSLTLKYSQRSQGTEETAEHFEVLAVARGSGGMLMLIARDRVSGTRYQILERGRNGGWRVRWTRPLSC